MKNIRLQFIFEPFTSPGFKLAQLGNINFSNDLNSLKVSIRMFYMQNLAFTIQKLMPPFKESGHD